MLTISFAIYASNELLAIGNIIVAIHTDYHSFNLLIDN